MFVQTPIQSEESGKSIQEEMLSLQEVAYPEPFVKQVSCSCNQARDPKLRERSNGEYDACMSCGGGALVHKNEEGN